MTRLIHTARASRDTRGLFSSLLAALVGGLLISGSTQAAIIGINAAASSASINFDDTNSSAPPNGTTNITPSVSPWTGATFSLPPTVDPVTFDTAQADIDATFAGNGYAVNFANVLLNQGFLGSAGTTGFAQMHILFTVEFQLDAGGLPSQSTLFPVFSVSGTVQNSVGSFAFLGGVINYYQPGNVLVESVTYNQTFLAPGPFGPTPVFGLPINGNTPVFAPNSTLTLDGNFSFVVDPAIMYVETQMVPEPSTFVLAGLGLLGLGFVALRKKYRRA